MKKAIYIVLTMVLMTLISFLLHLPFIILFTHAGGACTIRQQILQIVCLFPTWTLFTTVLIGIIAGYFVGQIWWRIIYIEKRRWPMRQK